MTPTEQDKKIIRGIEKALEKSFSYQVLVLNKECRDELVQLIIADRKRVALEARLDELGNIPNCNIESKYHGSTDVVLVKDVVARIAELKAQQEKL